jgi:transcriptional regulator with XRE-family HTH domain
MAANKGNSAATHFGRQMKKERLAHGWSLREFSARAGIDFTTASRIENGKRPPNETVADACDAVFPERRGWFREWYDEFTTWTEVPAGFRDWGELEDKSATLRVWTPGIIDGLLQTEDYARALISTAPKISAEAVTTRLVNRMERQRRVLTRDNPPQSWLLVDEFALYRLVGSPEIMAVQMGHILEAAALPNVMVQVLPAVAHPGNSSAFIVADSAVWCEHVAGGFTYVTEEIFSRTSLLFDSLRAESYRGSESLKMIERLGEIWASGVNPLTRMLPADSA